MGLLSLWETEYVSLPIGTTPVDAAQPESTMIGIRASSFIRCFRCFCSIGSLRGNAIFAWGFNRHKSDDFANRLACVAVGIDEPGKNSCRRICFWIAYSVEGRECSLTVEGVESVADMHPKKTRNPFPREVTPRQLSEDRIHEILGVTFDLSGEEPQVAFGPE